MKKALVAVAIASFGLAGCQEAYTDPGQGEGEALSGSEELIKDATNFNPLDAHLAALATEVLRCKNSFSPKDFVIDNRSVLTLSSDFRCDCRFTDPSGKQCNNEELLQNVKDFLAIQEYDLLPERKFGNANAVPYFAGMWKRFVTRLGRLT